MKKLIRSSIIATILLAIVAVNMGTLLKNDKPTLYIIGDSTVKNGSGKGEGGLWGWGSLIDNHFDTNKINIENHAIGGRSSRTFHTEGRWDKIMETLKPGDFVLIQFGHNDAGEINDDKRARGTIRGVGDETQEIDNILTGKHEVVHTFGWYLKKYIKDAKSKGATPIVLSLVARNRWENGRVIRASDSYAKWAEESAKAEGAFYIDLNDIVATHYEELGPEKVKNDLFMEDHTHTTLEGAKLNARYVVEGLASLKGCHLAKYLKKIRVNKSKK